MKNIIKKIIKYFSPLTMEMEVDGKRYKLVFVDFVLMEWLVKVKDLSTNKTIGYINISDESIVNRTVEVKAIKEIERLIQYNKSEEERKDKRKESMKYYFG
jgi:hypothetical protein